MKWLWVAIVIALGGAWHGWTTRALSVPPGIVAGAEPSQKEVGADVPRFRRLDADIVPVARFAMEARIIGAEHYRFDRMAKLAPVDLAFGWGPMSDSAVLARLSITQGNRFYFWSTSSFPIPRRDIEIHSANMHLIPASDVLARRIASARVGQVVKLSGYLVDVKTDDGWSIRSSLTREDTGAGACEVIWVEAFE